MKKLPIITACFIIFSIFSTVTLQAQDWQSVQKIIGSEGEIESGVLGFTFPRTDIQLHIYNTPVSSELAAKAWIGFWPQPDGKVMLMGDIAMPGGIVADVQQELFRQELEVTALHNHMLGEQPRLVFMHISGMDKTAESLAKKVLAVLKVAEVPLEKEPEEESEANINWSAVTDILGKPAEQEGDIIEYTFTRADLLTINSIKLPATEALETKPEVAFQMLENGEAATVGELFVRASEVNPVARALHKHNITITALHNHMLNVEPRMFWMHWWAKGDPGELAEGIQTALQEMNLQSKSP